MQDGAAAQRRHPLPRGEHPQQQPDLVPPAVRRGDRALRGPLPADRRALRRSGGGHDARDGPARVAHREWATSRRTLGARLRAARLAQLAEHFTCNEDDLGSNPGAGLAAGYPVETAASKCPWPLELMTVS